jgi:hypothetical protein
MCEIIQSRVLAGLIEVNPRILPLYSRNFAIKPSGDTDVIERQQQIKMMMESWPVIQNTPASVPFLTDLIEKMFPDSAPKYIQAFQQAQQQQQSVQAQQQQAMMQRVSQMAQGIVELSKHKDYFSEVGQLHAYPIVEQTANEIEQFMKQQQQNNAQQPANRPQGT